LPCDAIGWRKHDWPHARIPLGIDVKQLEVLIAKTARKGGKIDDKFG
jgi:hypothetical protein